LDFAQKDLGKRAAVGDFVANAFDAVGYLEISPLGWQLDKIECEPVARSCKAIYQNTGVGYNSDLLDVAKENPVVFSDDGRYAELAIEFDAESSFNSKLWFEHLPSHFVYQTEAFKPMQLAAASKKATIRANAPKAYKKPVGDWDVKRGEFVLNGENVWALIELSELIDDFVFFPSSLKLSYQPGRDLVSWILEGDYVFN
jgi:hypothetical protein